MKHGLLLVDIDQVVCDFVTPFCEWGNRVFDKNVSPEDVDCYDMFKLFGVTDMQAPHVLDLFFGSEPDIPEIPGAVAGIKALAQHHHIWYVTARPKSAELQTKMWLARRGIEHRVGHLTQKVSAIQRARKPAGGIVGMIEDNPATALEAAGHWPVWLLDYPYNREAEHVNITRVSSWPSLVEDILARDVTPRLTITEREYAEARFRDALRAYLSTISHVPVDMGYTQVVALPDGGYRLEVYLREAG